VYSLPLYTRCWPAGSNAQAAPTLGLVQILITYHTNSYVCSLLKKKCPPLPSSPSTNLRYGTPLNLSTRTFTRMLLAVTLINLTLMHLEGSYKLRLWYLHKLHHKLLPYKSTRSKFMTRYRNRSEKEKLTRNCHLGNIAFSSSQTLRECLYNHLLFVCAVMRAHTYKTIKLSNMWSYHLP
jgi:hypothetical protein